MKNNPLLSNTGLACVIWLATNGLAATMYHALLWAGFDFAWINCDWCTEELYPILGIGWAVSFPATILLLVLLQMMPLIKPGRARVWFSVASIIGIELIIVALFLKVFRAPTSDWIMILQFLIPYFVSAPISFFVFVRSHFREPRLVNFYWLLITTFLNKYNYGK